MWKQRAQLVQTDQHHKRHGMPLGCERHHVGAGLRHYASVCQKRMGAHQHLQIRLSDLQPSKNVGTGCPGRSTTPPTTTQLRNRSTEGTAAARVDTWSTVEAGRHRSLSNEEGAW